MHPFAFGNWRLLWKSSLHPKLYYSKKLGVQKCHKFLLFKAKHFFCKVEFLLVKHGLWHKKCQKKLPVWSLNVSWTNPWDIDYCLIKYLLLHLCVSWCAIIILVSMMWCNYVVSKNWLFVYYWIWVFIQVFFFNKVTSSKFCICLLIVGWRFWWWIDAIGASHVGWGHWCVKAIIGLCIILPTLCRSQHVNYHAWLIV